jgi:Domain of unknown function (DUF4259)
MGTWGEGPFDNDDAADLICRLSKPIDIVGSRKNTESARFHYNEARAVVQFLLLAHGTDILGGPELLPCVRALARIRRDAEWIADFRSPDTCMAQIDCELDAVLLELGRCKGCKKDRLEAEEIVEAARTVTMVDVKRAALGMRRVRKHRRKVRRSK